MPEEDEKRTRELVYLAVMTALTAGVFVAILAVVAPSAIQA